MPKTTKPDLRLVAAQSEVYDLMRAPQTTADRVRRLQAEARALAVEQVEALEKLLLETAALAEEIAKGATPIRSVPAKSRRVWPKTCRPGLAASRRSCRGRSDRVAIQPFSHPARHA